MVPDITTEVIAMRKRGGKTEVKVDVVGLTALPDFIKEMRARGRAIMASGVANTSVETVTDLVMGDIERFTELKGAPTKVTSDGIQESRVYTVIVNNG